MHLSTSLIKEYVVPVNIATYCPIQDTYYIGYKQIINVYNGLTWTDQQIEDDLTKQIINIHKILNATFGGCINTMQRAALTSLIHDIGMEVFLRSDFPRHLKNHNYILSSNCFLNFNRHNRVIDIRKTARRIKEQSIFNTKQEKYKK